MNVNDILIKMIRSIDLFKDLNDDEVLELAKEFKLEFYPKWSVIIREWTRPEYIYILKNWKLEARKANWLSKEVLGEINTWEIFWEMSYLDWVNAMATVATTEDSDIWQIPISEFDKFLKKYPNIMDKIYSTKNERQKQNTSIGLNNSDNSKQSDSADDDLADLDIRI